jgi:hypothetical protein
MPALLLALSLLAGPARAASPYMAGLGPNLQTIVVPASFPAYFGKDVRDAGVIDEVRGDLGIGAKGALYFDKEQRIGGQLDLGLGGGYRAVGFTAGYDRILTQSSGVGAFLGGAVGLGSHTFTDADTDTKLRVGTYKVRAQLGAIYRDKVRAYEANLFGCLELPNTQTLTDASGAESDQSGGFWSHLGLEATVYFGDFTVPNKDKKKKKNKNK